jgi:hypothetical protein
VGAERARTRAGALHAQGGLIVAFCRFSQRKQLSYAGPDGQSTAVKVSSAELGAFDDVRAAGAAVSSLAMSLDGACATPLHNFVQGLVGEKLRKRLGDAAPLSVCLQAGDFV